MIQPGGIAVIHAAQTAIANRYDVNLRLCKSEKFSWVETDKGVLIAGIRECGNATTERLSPMQAIREFGEYRIFQLRGVQNVNRVMSLSAESRCAVKLKALPLSWRVDSERVNRPVLVRPSSGGCQAW